MEEECSPSANAPEDDVPPFRIRIAHFFVLTAVCTALATIRIRWINWNDIPPEVVGYFKVQVGVVSLLFGAAFTASLILLGRWWRFGRSELKSPGQWLLLFLAIGASIQGLTAILLGVYSYYFVSYNFDFATWNIEQLVLCSIVGITGFIFCRLVAGNIWWKSIFALIGVVLFALIPQPLLMLAGVWRPWLPLAHMYASLAVSPTIIVLVLLASWSDARHNMHRDWMHWAGVFVVTLSAALEICSALYWIWNW